MCTQVMTPDEVDPTLADVLDYIDSFDTSSLEEEMSNFIRSTSTPRRTRQPKSSTKSQPSASRRKQKSDAARRCYRRKRSELLALRNEVKVLNSRIVSLIGNPNDSIIQNAPSGPIGKAWCTQVQIEKNLREEAEACNFELKMAIARQSRMAQSVGRILQNAVDFGVVRADALGDENAFCSTKN